MFKRSEQGFTLLEILSALLILMVCTSFMVPIFIQTLQERESIKQEEIAMSVLNESLNQWTINDKEQPSIISESGVQFRLKWKEVRNDHTKLCVKWENPSHRSKEICGETVYRD